MNAETKALADEIKKQIKELYDSRETDRVDAAAFREKVKSYTEAEECPQVNKGIGNHVATYHPRDRLHRTVATVAAILAAVVSTGTIVMAFKILFVVNGGG